MCELCRHLGLLGSVVAVLVAECACASCADTSACWAQSSLSSSLTGIDFLGFFAGGSTRALPPTGVGERGGGPCHAAAPAWLRGTGVAAGSAEGEAQAEQAAPGTPAEACEATPPEGEPAPDTAPEAAAAEAEG